MIISTIVLPVLLLSLLVAAKLMRIYWRTAFIFMLLNATFGLLIFSVLTIIPQLSVPTLKALPPEKIVSIMPIIVTFELLIGTYIASKILGLNYLKYLGLTLTTLSLTSVLSILFYLATF